MKILMTFTKILTLTLISVLSLFAETASTVPPVNPPPTTGLDVSLQTTLLLLVVVIAVVLYVVGAMDGNIDPIVDAAVKFRNYAIPQASEKVEDIGHEYDGIRELDNRVPPWFNYLFGVTIIFAAVYLFDYHVIHIAPLSHEEYNQEMAAAAMAQKIRLANEPLMDETKLTVITDPKALAEGDERFHKFCVSCHGQQGGGIVGPNLTDKYWIHGGGVSNVYQTIKNGVPSKGMISWGLVFSQRQILQLASYVLSLQGTNPPGGRAPQGTLWVEPKPSVAASDSVKANPKL